MGKLASLALLLGGCHLVFPHSDPSRPELDLLRPADRSSPDLLVEDASPPELRPQLDVRPSPDAAAARDVSISADLVPPPLGTWLKLAAGAFLMGSPTGEVCRETGGKESQHLVTLTHALWILQAEVSQTDFQKLMGYNPTTFACPKCPVDNVSWHQAAAYCNALSTLTQRPSCYTCTGAATAVACAPAAGYPKIQLCPGFRLPTEAEWEYAYRASSTFAYHNGNDSSKDCTSNPTASAIGWYKGNASGLKPSGGKLANSWQLVDMAGNLWEWCHDRGLEDLGIQPAVDPVTEAGTPKATSNHVVRGGSWGSPASELRAAHRQFLAPNLHGGTDGFRCVRTDGL
jgi:formylglycine-generating enzyme required for sulfatase activity